MEASNMVQVDYITATTLKKMNTRQKCDFAVKQVKNRHIVVFEGGLPPNEQTLLIKRTMKDIDHENFFGIDIVDKELQSNNEMGLFLFKRTLNYKITIVKPIDINFEFNAI